MSTLLTTIKRWNTEDRILNGAATLGIASLFFPWLEGEWLAEEGISYSGFEFFTAALGFSIGLLLLCTIILGLYPKALEPLGLKKYIDHIRAFLSVQAALLTIAALSVLALVTHQFTRMNITYGVYSTLLSSVLCALYSILEIQVHKRVRPVKVAPAVKKVAEEAVPQANPVPPPPPPGVPEEHKLHGK